MIEEKEAAKYVRCGKQGEKRIGFAVGPMVLILVLRCNPYKVESRSFGETISRKVAKSEFDPSFCGRVSHSQEVQRGEYKSGRGFSSPFLPKHWFRADIVSSKTFSNGA